MVVTYAVGAARAKAPTHISCMRIVIHVPYHKTGLTCSLSLNVSANVAIPVMLAITIVAHFLAGAKEKACSRTIKPEDGEAVNQKKLEVELKMQVHSSSTSFAR